MRFKRVAWFAYDDDRNGVVEVSEVKPGKYKTVVRVKIGEEERDVQFRVFSRKFVESVRESRRERDEDLKEAVG